MIESVVLDSSAVLAYVDDEDGADEVGRHLLSARKGRLKLYASFVTLTEVRYLTMQEKDEASADYLVGLIKSWPLNWVHSDERHCLLAARYKAEHSLSLADAFVAATADFLDAVLLHKDPEFEPLSGEIRLRALPYKAKRLKQ